MSRTRRRKPDWVKDLTYETVYKPRRKHKSLNPKDNTIIDGLFDDPKVSVFNDEQDYWDEVWTPRHKKYRKHFLSRCRRRRDIEIIREQSKEEKEDSDADNQ